MRIIELRAENFQRLTAVEIRPDGDVVQIGGLNGAGKTSLLDSIWAALGGARAIPTEPIRKGQQTALIKLDLGEFKITRTFARKEDGAYTTTLKVQAADGSRPERAQDFLNTIWNAYAVDPLRFVNMKPDEQFDCLKSFVPDVDFHAIAMANGKDFTARTDINRRAKELRAQADGIVLPPGKIPPLVDLAALEKKLGDAANHNSLIERRRANRSQAEARAGELEFRAKELRRQADELDREARELRAELAGAEPLPEPIDVSAVQAALAAGREGNAAAATAARRGALEREAADLEAESAALTARMEKRELDKQVAITAAKMPVHGISFGDGCVLLDGVPFEQGSLARRLRAGVEIAAAMNPKLRVVRISDGSLLDRNSRKWLAEFAAKNDLQVWLECVDDGPVGFVIEDGHLRGDVDEEEEAV